MTTKIENNEIIKAFEWRAAVKSFNKEKVVPEEDLLTILDSAVLSASSFGLQPYRIIEVTNKDLREKLKDAAYGQMQVVDAPHLYVVTAITNLDDKYVRKYIENIATTRGVEIESLKDFENSMNGSIVHLNFEQRITWSQRQSYLSLGSILETAALLEVDAGPMEGFDAAKVNEILGLTDINLHATAFVVLGYRENDKYSEMKKVRLPKEEFVIRM